MDPSLETSIRLRDIGMNLSSMNKPAVAIPPQDYSEAYANLSSSSQDELQRAVEVERMKKAALAKASPRRPPPRTPTPRNKPLSEDSAMVDQTSTIIDSSPLTSPESLRTARYSKRFFFMKSI